MRLYWVEQKLQVGANPTTTEHRCKLPIIMMGVLPYKPGFRYVSDKLHLEKDCFPSLLSEDFAYRLDCVAALQDFHQSVDLITQAAEQYTEVTYMPSAL